MTDTAPYFPALIRTGQAPEEPVKDPEGKLPHTEHDWSQWVFTVQSNEKRWCRHPGCDAVQYD